MYISPYDLFSFLTLQKRRNEHALFSRGCGQGDVDILIPCGFANFDVLAMTLRSSDVYALPHMRVFLNEGILPK